MLSRMPFPTPILPGKLLLILEDSSYMLTSPISPFLFPFPPALAELEVFCVSVSSYEYFVIGLITLFYNLFVSL